MHERFAYRGLLALCLVASTLGACSDRTAILVRVTSPLEIPSDIDELRFHVVGSTASMTLDRSFPGLTTTWPHALSLRPGAAESGTVTITVTGLHAGTFVVQRVVRATFAAGNDQVIDVVLPIDCRGVVCAEGLDCVGGRCESLMVDAGPRRDGGDSSVDGGVCACHSSADCDDALGCTMDICTDCVCEHRPDDTLCVAGSTCDPTTGCPLRSCTVDADCDDHRPCNGTETCNATAMTCLPGTPIDCDDADPCTTDICDDSVRMGACGHTTRDLDGDMHADLACAPGVGLTADDCDDTNADVAPGVPEDCNGIDDNCDTVCDEGFTCCRGTMGTCMTTCGTTGARTCNATCGWSVCSPPEETCNAIDDDCNGAADDVFACVQGTSEPCTTSCGSTGVRTCDGTCTWSACVAPAEICNGRDDDCVGGADDTFACVGGTTASCTTTCASTGTRACSATTCTASATCTPPAEGCNGVDDDCDTRIDETVECSPGDMQACMTSCGTTGNRVCSATCTYGSCTPPAEVCNSVDDNCDGRIDETFTCIPGSVGTCTSSCGTAGSRTCSASCAWGACTPPVETCNGLDDNCNSMCDESFSCCSGTSGACTTSCGSTGTRTCGTGTCVYGACFPPAEVCNGVDDDCNAVCDDGAGMACCRGRTGSCTTSCGSTGSRLCSASCAWGMCTPPAEICNGADDDCNGMIDDGFACTPGTMGPCTTGCGTTGSHVCSASCTFGVCTPPTEVCNTIDDNCDGTIDEGCGACVGCAGATAVSGGGGRYTGVTTASANMGSCGGGGGSERYLSFTLVAASDVFITTHQAGAVDTVLYVRSCACSGTEVACNNDADGRTTSALHLTNLASGTYHVFVDSVSAPIGTSIPVDIYISTPGMESDRCGNPTPILAAATMVSGNTCAYANDLDNVTITTDCPYPGGGDAADRLYYFYLPTSRSVTFSGCNAATTFDTLIYVRNVCNDGTLPAQILCNDDGCSGSPTSCTGGLRSSRTMTLGPGLFYFVVDGYDAAGYVCPCGPYQFTLTGI